MNDIRDMIGDLIDRVDDEIASGDSRHHEEQMNKLLADLGTFLAATPKTPRATLTI